MAKELAKQSGNEIMRVPSMLDEQYGLSLRHAVDEKKSSYAEMVRRAVDVALDADASKQALAKEGEMRYVVDITPEVQEQLKKGLVKFDYSKDGHIFAQLRDSKNHFGKKLPIKEELIEQGIDPLELKMAMQMMAVEQKLGEIADTLEDISAGVADVIRGQHNDRLGLYYSGMSLYLEAQGIEDETLRKLVASQSLRALSDAIGQMTQEIQEDIRYLTDGDYKMGKKGASVKAIRERIASIDKSFEVIHKAYLLKAAAYYNAGELAALLTTIDEYGRFIEHAIAPNAPKLSEFDPSDKHLIGGKWDGRSQAFAETVEMRRMLEEGSTFLIEAPNDEFENEEADFIYEG